MTKIFTIAPGLENMGAMRTGGQGSVYKGRRIGEIITAIKLLPTPIISEDDSNKSLRDFKNEVEKLQKVNEESNPNVVRILSSGLSETGSFPFIEMEYIEGPDLEELLQPPHEAVFTIKEILKVADHLSNALAHCHRNGITHGDIKSNNVKFNLRTGNYVLLDFGLAVMNDEQRRTSLRHAGAVEFMAPEQNEGQTLRQTDVYSFGIILFELLAGKVPFPLNDQGETSRNSVRLSHMETLPPDVMALRQQSLPQGWDKDKKDTEMKVPEWIVNMLNKCLKKKPDNRFTDGVQLHDYIIYNIAHNPLQNDTFSGAVFKGDTMRLENENEQLQQQVTYYRQQLIAKDKEMDELKSSANMNVPLNAVLNSGDSSYSQRQHGVSKTAFFFLLLFTIALGAFSAYTYFHNQKPQQQILPLQGNDTNAKDTAGKSRNDTPHLKKSEEPGKKKTVKPVVSKTDSLLKNKHRDEENEPKDDSENSLSPEPVTVKYKVVNKAYFYGSPDEATRRNAYMASSDNTTITPTKEKNGFIYIVFINQFGQTSKGWLRKSDLKEVEE